MLDGVLAPLEALTRLAMRRRTLETMRGSEQDEDDEGEDEDDEDDEGATKKLGDVIVHPGFNSHASVTIAARDDQGRERLCAKHRVMEPGEFLGAM